MELFHILRSIAAGMTKWRSKQNAGARLTTTLLVFHFFLEVTLPKESSQLLTEKKVSFKSSGLSRVRSTSEIGTRTSDSSTVPLSFLALCAT